MQPNQSPSEPLVIRDLGGQPIGAVRIEAARQTGSSIRISGWSVGRLAIELTIDGQRPEQTLTRSARPDIARSLSLDEHAPGFGFLLSAITSGAGSSAELRIQATQRNGSQLHIVRHPFAIERTPPVRSAPAPAGLYACIDGASASATTRQGLLNGWMIHDAQTRILLQRGPREIHFPDDAYRFFRSDLPPVREGIASGSSARAGFIALIDDVAPGDAFDLIARDANGDSVLTEVRFDALAYAPVDVARRLFAIHTPTSEFHRRVARVDGPLLGPLIERHAAAWRSLDTRTATLGQPPALPEASLIIPIHGRIDFVEHQLIEFARDPALCARAEILYVLDDPALVDAFAHQADQLHQVTGVPMRWIWGGANRGFAGASNLGAEYAAGSHLVFMNSDVIPDGSGWLEPLLSALQQDDALGAIGPSLLFTDGSIQHAGMVPVRRDALGVWINHHPRMGLAASLDASTGVTEMPFITGACMVVRESDFRRVGGWDTGYLIGDFEDSDLCLKLRAIGKRSAYLPTVRLTHLGRQSFQSLGTPAFRNSVVLYNALRHQQRWGAQLERLANQFSR